MLRATRQCHRSSRHILLIVLLKPSSYSRFSSCGEGKIKFIHNRRETFAESVRLVRVSVGSAENSRRRRKGEGQRIAECRLWTFRTDETRFSAGAVLARGADSGFA